MHVGLAGALLERDDIVGAADQLAAADQLGEANGLPQNPYRSRLVRARLLAVGGDLDGALEQVEAAERVYVGDYSPNVRPVPAVRARLLVRRGELGRADAWAAETGLSVDDELSYLREFEHITLARILLARQASQPDAAELHNALRFLERLLEAAESQGRGGSVLELLVLLALGHHQQRAAPAALAALQRAVTAAEAEGAERVLADEGPPMAALLNALSKRGGSTAYVRRLIAVASGGPQTPATPSRLVTPLSEREHDVLRLLATDLGGPAIARQLSVSLNTLRTHTKSIYAKLGVTSRRTAVSRALELDLLAHQGHRDA